MNEVFSSKTTTIFDKFHLENDCEKFRLDSIILKVVNHELSFKYEFDGSQKLGSAYLFMSLSKSVTLSSFV